jgi:hypothetical protein
VPTEVLGLLNQLDMDAHQRRVLNLLGHFQVTQLPQSSRDDPGLVEELGLVSEGRALWQSVGLAGLLSTRLTWPACAQVLDHDNHEMRRHMKAFCARDADYVP